MKARTAEFIEKTNAFINKSQMCSATNVGYVESIWEMENGDLEWVASLCKDEESKICYESYYNFDTQEFVLHGYAFDEDDSKNYKCNPEDMSITCDTGYYCGIDSYSDYYHYDTYTGTVYETHDDGSVAVYYRFKTISMDLGDLYGKLEEEILNIFKLR